MKKIVIASIATLALATASFAGVNAAACAGCHGKDWSKTHMGNVDVSKMSHADIATALKGYKAKTRNAHGKGAMMYGQVGRYSEADLVEFSNTIGK